MLQDTKYTLQNNLKHHAVPLINQASTHIQVITLIETNTDHANKLAIKLDGDQPKDL